MKYTGEVTIGVTKQFEAKDPDDAREILTKFIYESLIRFRGTSWMPGNCPQESGQTWSI